PGGNHRPRPALHLGGIAGDTGHRCGGGCTDLMVSPDRPQGPALMVGLGYLPFTVGLLALNRAPCLTEGFCNDVEARPLSPACARGGGFAADDALGFSALRVGLL